VAGTPKWGVLHLRLASGARDAVTSASIDGKSLKSVDRDAYLNYAWSKYVSLFYHTYQNDPTKIMQAMRDLAKAGQASITGAGLIAFSGLPTDYGLCLSLDKSNVNTVSRLTTEEYIKIKNSHNPIKIASDDNQYYCPQGRDILILPNTISSGTYDIAYLLAPFNIVYSATVGVDIPLDEVHFDSIVDFALSQYHEDRQEYELAKIKEEHAFASAPYPLAQKG
jgi:hypothetical protein